MKNRIREAFGRWKTKHARTIINTGRLLHISDKHIVAFMLSDISKEELDFGVFIGQAAGVLQTIARNRNLNPHDYFLHNQFIKCISGQFEKHKPNDPASRHIVQMFERTYAIYRQNPQNTRQFLISELLKEGYITEVEANNLKGQVA